MLWASISLPTDTKTVKKIENSGICKNSYLMVYMLVLSSTVLVDKHCPAADRAFVQWQLQLELSKVIFVVINTQLVLCYCLMTHICVLAGRSSQCTAFWECSVWWPAPASSCKFLPHIWQCICGSHNCPCIVNWWREQTHFCYWAVPRYGPNLVWWAARVLVAFYKPGWSCQ